MPVLHIILATLIVLACTACNDVFIPKNTQNPPIIRIMPLGDSITTGYTNNPSLSHPFEFGYRSELYTLLTRGGYGFEFVGRSTEPWIGDGDSTRGGTYTPPLDLRKFG